MEKYTELEKEAICLLTELERKKDYTYSNNFLFDLNEMFKDKY